MRCENENRCNREAWGIVELGPQPELVRHANPITTTSLGNENAALRSWINELAKLDLRTSEIRELVQIAFPGVISQGASVVKQVD